MGEYEEIKEKRQGLYTQIRELGGKRKEEKAGTPAFAELTGEMDAIKAEVAKMREPYEKAFAAEYGCKPASLKISMRLSPSHLAFKIDDEAAKLFWSHANRMIRKDWAKVSEKLEAKGLKTVTKADMSSVVRVRVTPEEKEAKRLIASAQKDEIKAADKKARAKKLAGKV